MIKNHSSYTDEDRLEYVERFKDSGLSATQFCTKEGVDRGTLRRWACKFDQKCQHKKKPEPKTLIWDVECSTMRVEMETYDLSVRHRSRLNDADITRDWIMLGAAWKWLGDDNISVVSVSPKDPLNDYEVIRKLYNAIDEADILVGHNSDSFDLKKFNTRALRYRMPPILKRQSVDTLKLARQHFKFSSNKLRYVAKFLGVEDKDESPDWPKCLAGDADELRYMRQYNKQDVITTEQVYLELRGYHERHPDANRYHEITDIEGKPVHLCPKCSSDDYSFVGYDNRLVRPRKEYFCNSCKSSFSRKD